MAVALLLSMKCQDTPGLLQPRAVGGSVPTGAKALPSWMGTADAGGEVCPGLWKQNPVFCSKKEQFLSGTLVKGLALSRIYSQLLSCSLCAQGEAELSNVPLPSWD